MNLPESRLSRLRVAQVASLLSNRVPQFCIYLLAICLAMFSAVRVEAQDIGGNLRGTVTDKTGAGIPLAKATLTNTETNATFNTPVNSHGEYQFTAVPPGKYKLVVKAADFGATTIDNVIINLNQTENLPVSLEVGSASTSVEVTGESEKVVTEETAVVGLFTANEIRTFHSMDAIIKT